jgi:hypothetical protein
VIGVDWTRVDVEQFRMGMEAELEHGVRNVVTNVTKDDLRLTGRIALAHLMKFPDYYSRPARMEDAPRGMP